MEAEVPGAVKTVGFHLGRGVGLNLPRIFIEPVLVDAVGAVARDVGNEGIGVVGSV